MHTFFLTDGGKPERDFVYILTYCMSISGTDSMENKILFDFYIAMPGGSPEFHQGRSATAHCQPSLGRQVQDLEDEIGGDLLKRSPASASSGEYRSLPTSPGGDGLQASDRRPRAILRGCDTLRSRDKSRSNNPKQIHRGNGV